MIKGRYADIANAVENRKAGSITAAEFLHRFVGDVPWAHLDIAGVAVGHRQGLRAQGRRRATACGCSVRRWPRRLGASPAAWTSTSPTTTS